MQSGCKVIDASTGSKQRIATVSVRKDGDPTERFDLKIPVINKTSGFLPIGSIIPFVGDLKKIPYGWYLCDGTNGTPDLRNRFLEGVGGNNVKQFVDAGLPNITGVFNSEAQIGGVTGPARIEGSFYMIPSYRTHLATRTEGYNHDIGFDASRSSKIYGKSTTVQPNSYTVYYIIRMK